MKYNEKIFVNVLNFIPDMIVQKREIKLSISEKDLDKYIDEHVYTDASIFNEIDLNTGDTIIYKGKVFNVNITETPDDKRKFIMFKLQDQKFSENKKISNFKLIV